MPDDTVSFTSYADNPTDRSTMQVTVPLYRGHMRLALPAAPERASEIHDGILLTLFKGIISDHHLRDPEHSRSRYESGLLNLPDCDAVLACQLIASCVDETATAHLKPYTILVLRDNVTIPYKLEPRKQCTHNFLLHCKKASGAGGTCLQSACVFRYYNKSERDYDLFLILNMHACRERAEAASPRLSWWSQPSCQ
jgi:hypothetical protein